MDSEFAVGDGSDDYGLQNAAFAHVFHKIIKLGIVELGAGIVRVFFEGGEWGGRSYMGWCGGG